jgi:putative ABC transport system substrate-binding protein
MGGKWISLLKEIAPSIKRAGFVFNPDTVPGLEKYFLASFEAAAGSLGIEPVAMHVRSDAEIETAVATLGAEQAGLVEWSPFLAVHLERSFPRRLATTCPRFTRSPYGPG